MADVNKVRGKFAKKSSVKKSKRFKYYNQINKEMRNKDVNEHIYTKRSEFIESPSLNERRDDHQEVEPTELSEVAANEDVTDEKSISWKDGRRIVELQILAENLVCQKCHYLLHLPNTTDERRYGLGSLLSIKCMSCNFNNTVSTGKRNEKGAFDVNSKLSLAMVHSGMGPTHVLNFLSSCNIPPPDVKTLRKKEKEISTSIVRQTTESCLRAREEEIKACDSMECSFDAGWQTRGSGSRYNSSSGHASLVGVKTGKILEYDTRSKSCSICKHHIHCRTIRKGSSKAMEPDMAANMLRRMKETGHEVKTIHADNDSTTTARLKVDFKDLEKKCDKNHLNKNLGKQLYALSKSFKQLKANGVITYITKSFMHPISMTNESDEEMSTRLSMVVPHIFGDHDLCIQDQWCGYHKNPDEYRYKYSPDGKPLSGEALREELNKMVDKLKGMVPQLRNIGSTQSNENFNHIVASKAPKNRSYGDSLSLTTRVSAAVLQKNDGYTFVEKVNRDALLSPGAVLRRHAIVMDRRNLWHKQRDSSVAYKRRRLMLKKRRCQRETTHEIKEGDTHGSDIAVGAEENFDTETIPSKITLKGNERIVVFDLEITGLARTSDIVQLAAFDGEEEFNKYITPHQPISPKASEITSITYSFATNKMYHHGEEVESDDIRTSLLQFIEYLSKRGKPVLVGHNISSFDIPILSRCLHNYRFLSEFLNHTSGCLDTYKLARKLYSKEHVQNYRQQTLVSVLLGKTYEAHNALQDVRSLYEVFMAKITYKSEDVFAFNAGLLVRSYGSLIDRNSCLMQWLGSLQTLASG